jgi:hypothetical protein
MYKSLIVILIVLFLFIGQAAANSNNCELVQINSTHWYFKSAQTGLSDGIYSYQAYANNISSDYRVVTVDSIYPPTVVLISQTPSEICQNCTGNISILYGVAHDSSGLNNTSVSFIYRDYDHDLGDSNHSMSGLDENNTEVNIVPVNDTYTRIYINSTIHRVMPQMHYIDRSEMQEAPKTQIAIHKSQNVLVKFWNFEIFKGNTDFLGAGYTDTYLNPNPTFHPSDANPVNYYYVSSGYDPSTGSDPLASGYAVFMGSLNASEWVDYVHTPHANASYVRGFIDNNLLELYVNTTNISYLYFTSNTQSSKPFYINVTDVATSSNVSFADTKTLWAGDTVLSQQSFTPDIWFAFMKGNMSFDHKIYIADNNDKWANSTLSSTVVGAGLFPPTKPAFYAFHNGFQDFNMNGTYHGTIQVQVSASSDPDGGPLVPHNLTLHYDNGTLVATINGSATAEDGVYTNISFDTTLYSTLYNYTLRVVATDDEGETAITWLGVNFTINYDNFTFTNSGITPSAIRENEPFTVSVDINDSDGSITTAIVKINYHNYTMTQGTGDTWSYTFTGTQVPTRYYVTDFYAEDNDGDWNSSVSTLWIDAVSSTGTGSTGGISPTVTPTPTPIPTKVPVEVEEAEEDLITNISKIIERTISEDESMMFRFNINPALQVYNKELYMENALYCTSPSDLVKECIVEDEMISIDLFFEPDTSSFIYNEKLHITVYKDSISEYIELRMVVINLMWSLKLFESDIDNPSTLFFSNNEFGYINGIRVWWIVLILIIIGGVIFYGKSKKR